ncbi:MAG: hypothetical protein C4523_02495 [Myxococcales bacterium]|nr:MAG: hypothetical protein C4523_02495 [Myxococcales bacterium]
MARTTTVSAKGSAGTQSAWIPLDQHISPFNVGFGVVKSGTGDITYSVQHTFNDVLAGETATAFDHSSVSGATGSVDGNYAYPVKAVRLNITAASGASSLQFYVIQAGITQ